MKPTTWICGVLLAGLMAVVGCSKSGTPPPPSANGVTIDTPKLYQAFGSNTDKAIQANLEQVAFGLRYSDYMKCLAALDQLANNPNVTPDQKKVVNQVIEQIKQVMSKAPAAKAGQ